MNFRTKEGICPVCGSPIAIIYEDNYGSRCLYNCTNCGYTQSTRIEVDTMREGKDDAEILRNIVLFGSMNGYPNVGFMTTHKKR